MTPQDTAEHHRARREAELRLYSRGVRWMKAVLPIGALGLIALIFLDGQGPGGDH